MAKPAFKKRKIRNNFLDYMLQYLLGSGKNRLATSLVGISVIALLLTSVNFASAAPNQAPPNGNVKPNFDGVHVESVGSSQTTSLGVGDTSSNIIDLKIRKNNATTTQLSMSSLLTVLSHSSVLGLISGNTSLTLDAASNQISFQAGRYVFAGNVQVSGTLNANRLEATTVSGNTVTGTQVTGSNGRFTNFYTDELYSNVQGYFDFHQRAYFNEEIFVDDPNGIGFATDGYLFTRSDDSRALDRSTAQSGNDVFVPCGTDAFVAVCAYNVAGNGGNLAVTPQVTNSGRSCSFSYSGPASGSGTAIVKGKALCFKSAYAGL